MDMESDTNHASFTFAYPIDDIFSGAIAGLSANANLVQFKNEDQLADIEVTPELTIMCDVSMELLQSLLQRGFELISVFVKDDTPYLVDGMVFDKRVVIFGIDAIYEHIVIDGKPIEIYMLDHIASALFPEYKSGFGTVTAANGKNLIRALKYSGSTTIAADLAILCTIDKGFDDIEKLVHGGDYAHSVIKSITTQAIMSGITTGENVDTLYATLAMPDALLPDVVEKLPCKLKYKNYRILYNYMAML
jgi:hypothetical protein